jgi:uncharacterized protein (TIGR00730 family)
MKSICVFCGSNSGDDPVYLAAAEHVGEFLASRGISLVFGGGRVGLMGKIADTVMSRGGTVTGIIPAALDRKEVAHKGLTKLHIVNSMHERKAMMAELSDGFIALPGGFGTFEEFFEIVTWAQLGIHQKPCGLLNINGFYDPLIELARHSSSQGFIRKEHLDLILIEDNIEDLFRAMEDYTPPLIEKWIDETLT